MSKDMKQLLILWGTAIVLAAVVFAFIASDVNGMKADAISVPDIQGKCPDGSYQIGYDKETEKPACHLNPTGCIYGDSIPLADCVDKSSLPQITTVAPDPPAPYDPKYDPAKGFVPEK